MTSTRAFWPWDLRQQRAATIVYDAAGLRSLITYCILKNLPCNAILGDNISTPAGFTIPSTLKGFSLDFNAFKVIATGTIATLFNVQAAPAVFQDTKIALSTGAVVTNLFSLATSTAIGEVIIGGLNVDASAGTLTNLFAAGTATVSGLVVEGGDIANVSNLFAPDAAVWRSCRLADLVVSAPGGVTVTLGNGAGGVAFAECSFERIDGPLTINIGSLSTANLFACCRGTVSPACGVTTSSADIGKGNVFLGMDFFSVSALSGGDVWLASGGSKFTAINGSLSTLPASATLNSAGPTLIPTVASFIRVTHGASASGNVTIAQGHDGQRLTLFFVSVAGTAVYTDGSGNLELAGNFTPTSNDTLSLIYDATSLKWIELARSVN